MRYFSTRDPERRTPVTLRHAVLHGLAEDGGLYMPEHIPMLSSGFLQHLPERSLQEIAFAMLRPFIPGGGAGGAKTGAGRGADSKPLPQGDSSMSDADLEQVLRQTLDFPIPLVPVDSGAYALELFHGPTLAFKDVGARFMARLMAHFIRGESRELHVLVATSGDTGGAVAAGFHRVPGIRVWILYPKGKVSALQEKQLTGWGDNITALEVDGTFDECQALVKRALADEHLADRMRLTSANSINIARLLPQSVYYGWAVAQWLALQADRQGGNPGSSAAGAGSPEMPSVPIGPAISIPSGNFGNLTAALLAARAGIPISRLIAATNRNDVVPEFLETGVYRPRPSVRTLSNAMDVGAPSNYERLAAMLGQTREAFSTVMSGYAYQDAQVCDTIREVHARTGYLLDPHGAIGYMGLRAYGAQRSSGDAPGAATAPGIFLETAHPIKFRDEVIDPTGIEPDMPAQAREFLARAKYAIPATSEFSEFKEILSGGL